MVYNTVTCLSAEDFHAIYPRGEYFAQGYNGILYRVTNEYLVMKVTPLTVGNLNEIISNRIFYHTNILPMVDFLITDTEIISVFPLCTRISEALNDTKISIQQVTTDIAEAIYFLANYGFEHRDISADNILFYEDRAVLADLQTMKPVRSINSRAELSALVLALKNCLEEISIGKIGKEMLDWLFINEDDIKENTPKDIVDLLNDTFILHNRIEFGFYLGEGIQTTYQNVLEDDYTYLLKKGSGDNLPLLKSMLYSYMRTDLSRSPVNPDLKKMARLLTELSGNFYRIYE